MGEKQVSVRTLKSGEKVTHYPGGKQVLVPTNNEAARMAETWDDALEASKAKDEQRLAAVEEKRAKLASGNPVPEEKRPI